MRLYCKEGKARGQFVLQYNILCCDLGARQGWTVLQYSAQPSHDTATVATTRRWAGALGRAGGRTGCTAGAQAGSRRRRAGRAGKRVLGERASATGRAGARDMRLRHDRWGLRHGSQRLRYGRAARPRYGAGLATTRTRARAPGHAWCAGCANWGLMQLVWFLTWVFDSVVFLSHRLDSVHEHCSLQNFS